MATKRPKTEPQNILLLPPNLDQIEGFAECLNTEFVPLLVPGKGGWRGITKDYRPVRQHLHSLVKKWRDSGPNVAKLWDSDPGLAREIGTFRAIFQPTQGSFGKLIYDADPKTISVTDPLNTALGLFLAFLLNPNNIFLCGPCGHCGRYFVRRNHRKRVYCTKKCGLTHTAKATIEKRRAEEYADKLRRVREVIKNFKTARCGKSWKEAVFADTHVSKNWITRAVKRGDVVPPGK